MPCCDLEETWIEDPQVWTDSNFPLPGLEFRKGIERDKDSCVYRRNVLEVTKDGTPLKEKEINPFEKIKKIKMKGSFVFQL